MNAASLCLILFIGGMGLALSQSGSVERLLSHLLLRKDAAHIGTHYSCAVLEKSNRRSLDSATLRSGTGDLIGNYSSRSGTRANFFSL
jgi:hypothetical protein